MNLPYHFADVAIPAHATDCGAWSRHGDDDWRRPFLIKEWEIAGLWVSVAGEQDHHGKVTRWLHVGGHDQCTTSDRQDLIAALTAAGELLDSLVPPRHR
jgi:hypothetical protein